MLKMISVICILILFSTVDSYEQNQQLQAFLQLLPNTKTEYTNDGLKLQINLDSDVTCSSEIKRENIPRFISLAEGIDEPNAALEAIKWVLHCRRNSTGQQLDSGRLISRYIAQQESKLAGESTSTSPSLRPGKHTDRETLTSTTISTPIKNGCGLKQSFKLFHTFVFIVTALVAIN